jgi:transglutaminase-like putative cysteine protease
MKNLSGKCADLNALFVGLARASGLPARDLYGLRVAPSTQFPSLGRAGGDVTTAQHCRAEVWADTVGWIPVDPADVRKLILEEKKPAQSDPYVAKVRDALFGSWEMNWIAFNDAHDVVLPGSKGTPLPFLMYPQAEEAGVRRDSLEPQKFRYTITAREM